MTILVEAVRKMPTKQKQKQNKENKHIGIMIIIVASRPENTL